MKKIFLLSVLSFTFIFASAKPVTFSKWEATAISESINKDGSVTYTAHFKGKAYILTFDQYADLIAGMDITLNEE